MTIWLRICAVSCFSGEALPWSESVRSVSTPSRIAFITSLRFVNRCVFGFGWIGRVSTVIGFWPGMLNVNEASVSVAVPVGPPLPAVQRPSIRSRLATRPPSPNCCLAWASAPLIASVRAWPPPVIPPIAVCSGAGSWSVGMLEPAGISVEGSKEPNEPVSRLPGFRQLLLPMLSTEPPSPARPEQAAEKPGLAVASWASTPPVMNFWPVGSGNAGEVLPDLVSAPFE